MAKKHNNTLTTYLLIVLAVTILLLLSQHLFPNSLPANDRSVSRARIVQKGERQDQAGLNSPLPCANSISCTNNLSEKYDPQQIYGEYMGKSIPIPNDMFDQKISSSSVLGKSTSPGKKIYVNLTTQKLYAYEDNRLIYMFTISSGKWNPTPVGKFYIWTKLLATRMEGGNKENNTYYNLPNVPYTMYFYNENVGKWNGYGIHGAYWPTNWGKPDTFGCVSLHINDAAKIYYWADAQPSGSPTPVIIFGKAPPV